jgi:hypothetical protein
MKNNTTTLHDEIKFNDREPGSKAVKEPEVWKLGLDVDLRHVVVGMQCSRSTIGPAWKFRREQLIEWVKQKRAQGEVVPRCMRAAGLGTPCTRN